MTLAGISRRLPGIGSHHSTNPQTDEWLTPPEILERLGRFDLDPCAPVDRPWPTAAQHLTVEDDGLDCEWHGRVWLNPPYSGVAPWMRRLAQHGHGTALVDHVWPHATGLLFVKGRMTFRYPDGTSPKRGHNAGGPSVLIAYGTADAVQLQQAGIPGAYVPRAALIGGAP
jgi:hypothetical protein